MVEQWPSKPSTGVRSPPPASAPRFLLCGGRSSRTFRGGVPRMAPARGRGPIGPGLSSNWTNSTKRLRGGRSRDVLGASPQRSRRHVVVCAFGGRRVKDVRRGWPRNTERPALHGTATRDVHVRYARTISGRGARLRPVTTWSARRWPIRRSTAPCRASWSAGGGERGAMPGHRSPKGLLRAQTSPLTRTAEREPPAPSLTETTFQPSAARALSAAGRLSPEPVSTAYSGVGASGSSPCSTRFLKAL